MLMWREKEVFVPKKFTVQIILPDSRPSGAVVTGVALRCHNSCGMYIKSSVTAKNHKCPAWIKISSQSAVIVIATEYLINC